MGRALRKTAGVMGAGAGAVALLGLGYAGITWYRYGKVGRGAGRNHLVDRFMPKYEVREVHQTRVEAPADVTFAAAHELDLRRSTIVRAIFTGRELLMGGSTQSASTHPGFWPRSSVWGGVSWPRSRDASWSWGGYPALATPMSNSAGWPRTSSPRSTIRGTPRSSLPWGRSAGRRTSLFCTETRVVTTDPESRSRFRRYWSVFSPGILLIRYETLRLVKREAERLAALEVTPEAPASLAGQQTP